MTVDPTRRLSSLDLFDEDEDADPDEWGNRAVLTEPVTPVSLPEAFAAQVGRTPDAVALRCGDCSWTYRELDGLPTGWRTCWPSTVRARDNVWRCCWSAQLRP